MLPLPSHRLQLCSLWTLVSTLTLFANPWWGFGWVEIAASTGPWILGVDRRIRLALALAVGLPGIAGLCLLDPGLAIVPRLLVASAVFGVGALLTSRMIAERIAGEPSEESAYDAFARILEKEFGRARRHERGFAILSLAAEPRSLPADGAARHADAPLAELAGLLARELHVYSDVVVARERVLALVPEVEGAAAEVLVKRVQSVFARELDFGIRIGAACFPRDAISVDNLIAEADRERTNPKRQDLPDRAANPDRKVQG